MFGNTTGWICSAIIAAVMAGLLYYVAVPPKPSEPTGAAAFKIAHGRITLPVSPTTVVPAGTDNCDAGTLYRKAIDGYQAHVKLYDRFESKAMSVSMEQLPELQDIIDATHCKNFSLFARRPKELVNYDNEEPALHAIEVVGNDAVRMGMLLVLPQQNKPEEARKLLEGAFELGARLYEERVTFRELAVGHGLMQSAAPYLRNLAKDEKNTARAKQIQNFM